jgi:hypothetical protein
MKTRKEEVIEMLAFIRDPANAKVRISSYWIEGVLSEARQLGIISERRSSIGANCKPGIDRGIVYGGDYEDVF